MIKLDLDDKGITVRYWFRTDQFMMKFVKEKLLENRTFSLKPNRTHHT